MPQPSSENGKKAQDIPQDFTQSQIELLRQLQRTVHARRYLTQWRQDYRPFADLIIFIREPDAQGTAQWLWIIQGGDQVVVRRTVGQTIESLGQGKRPNRYRPSGYDRVSMGSGCVKQQRLFKVFVSEQWPKRHSRRPVWKQLAIQLSLMRIQHKTTSKLDY